MCKETINIVFVGPLDRHGGVDLLIQAIAMARVDWPELTCDVLGDGDLRQALSNLCAWLKVEEIIHINLGESRNPEEYYHLFVSGSRSDELIQQQMRQGNLAGLPMLVMKSGVVAQDEAMQRALSWHPLNAMSEQATPESLAELILSYCRKVSAGEADPSAIKKEAAEYFKS